MDNLDDKIEGKATELKGRVTDDQSEEVKGEALQTGADFKDTAENVKDKVTGDNR